MSSHPNEQPRPACLGGRVSGEHETEPILLSSVMRITTLHTAHTCLLLADIRTKTETVHAALSQRWVDFPRDYQFSENLGESGSLSMEKEATKVMRYHDLDIRTSCDMIQ